MSRVFHPLRDFVDQICTDVRAVSARWKRGALSGGHNGNRVAESCPTGDFRAPGKRRLPGDGESSSKRHRGNEDTSSVRVNECPVDVLNQLPLEAWSVDANVLLGATCDPAGNVAGTSTGWARQDGRWIQPTRVVTSANKGKVAVKQDKLVYRKAAIPARVQRHPLQPHGSGNLLDSMRSRGVMAPSALAISGSSAAIKANDGTQALSVHGDFVATMRLPFQLLPQVGPASFTQQVSLPSPAMDAAARWATLFPPQSSVETKRAPRASRRTSRNGSPDLSGKRCLPRVPSFVQPDAWQLYRRLEVGPKSADDNYAISDREDEGEPAEGTDRSQKRVPKWVDSYLSSLTKQSRIDPDTIFGTKVPRCDLDVIFTDELYMQCSLQRPKRKRGSSGKWDKDNLKKAEVNEYRIKMGQKDCWTSKVRHR